MKPNRIQDALDQATSRDPNDKDPYFLTYTSMGCSNHEITQTELDSLYRTRNYLKQTQNYWFVSFKVGI